MFHIAYFFELLRERKPSKIILFLISFLSMFLMIIPFIGIGLGAKTFEFMLLISLFILSLCFSSGVLSFGNNQDLLTVLIGNTLGFGFIIFGTLLNHSIHWELYIFVILFYVATILGYLVSKLFTNKIHNGA